jgi:hypothetical protein
MNEQFDPSTPPFGAPLPNFVQVGNNKIVDDFASETTSTKSEDEVSNFGQPFIGITPAQNQISEKQKYQIVDLFWMINPNLYAQQPKIVQGQAQFVVISYNISFSNLRVSFFDIAPGAIQNNVVFLNNMQRTVSGTIYPASAFCAVNRPRISTICLEQLFKATGEDWQQSRPKCLIEKNEEIIRFTIDDAKNGKYFYDFVGWQRDAFLYACQFCYTTGLYLHGLNMLK